MIKDRVIQIIDYKGITRECFFKKIGMTSANFRGKAKDTPLNSNAIANILSEVPEINPEWLINGSQPMLKGNTPVSLPSNQGIPLIPIDAMAGIGTGDTQVMEYEAERFVVPTFKGADFLISVKGSSMYPKYNSGDIVACKKLSLSDIFFQWNKVYVLDTDQGALIKRVKKGSKQGYITCISDNDNYDPFELKIDSQLNAIALVIGVIRLE